MQSSVLLIASLSSVPTFMPFLRSGPPPEVCVEIDEAWERAQWPLPHGVHLEFDSAPSEGRAWGELRLADGAAIALLSATEAVALACGDAAMLAVAGTAA
jgi:hypothetical protein